MPWVSRGLWSLGKEGRKEGAVPRVGETGVTFVILRQDENSQEGHCAACRGRDGGRCLDRGLLSPREEGGWVTCCAESFVKDSWKEHK